MIHTFKISALSNVHWAEQHLHWRWLLSERSARSRRHSARQVRWFDDRRQRWHGGKTETRRRTEQARLQHSRVGGSFGGGSGRKQLLRARLLAQTKRRKRGNSFLKPCDMKRIKLPSQQLVVLQSWKLLQSENRPLSVNLNQKFRIFMTANKRMRRIKGLCYLIFQ